MKQLEKQNFLQMVKSNIKNSYNEQFLYDHALNLVDVLDDLNYNISVAESYDDNRFFKITDTNNNLVGRSFITKDSFNTFFNNNKCYFTYHIKKSLKEDKYFRTITYKDLQPIDKNDEELMQEIANNFYHNNGIIFYVDEDYYFASHQVEACDVFAHGYLEKVNASVFNYNIAKNQPDEDIYEAICYKYDDEYNHKKTFRTLTSDGKESIFTKVIPETDIEKAIPMTKMKVVNGKIVFNVEDFIKNGLNSEEIKSDNEEKVQY